MIVIHASLWNKRLAIWGEVPFDADKARQTKKRGRPGKAPPPKPHPYNLSLEEIERLFQVRNIFFTSTEKFLAWLPTAQDLPLPSSPLIGSSPESTQSPVLAPWAIYGAILEGKGFSQLLPMIRNQEMLQKGVVLGKEFSFLVRAFDFTLTLIGRQRYLPEITQEGSSYVASWEPVFLGRDYERFSQLAEAFPSALRCLSPSMKQKSPPEEHPKELLATFMQLLMEEITSTTSTELISAETIHDEWIQKMRTPQRTLAFPSSDCYRLKEQLQDWKKSLAVALHSPFRFCLRLEEPPSATKGNEGEISLPKDPWFVRYLLQSNEDPSLLLDVQEVWNPKGQKRKILERDGFHARQFLLSSLGIASSMVSEIEESLKSSTPVGYELSTADAYKFLTDKAAMLEDTGYGVILPRWWSGKGTKKKLTASALITSPMTSEGKRSLWDIVKMDWELALGDKKISIEELETLVKLKESLVMVRGEWVQLNQQDIERAILFWKSQQNKQTTLQDVVQIAVGQHKEAKELEIIGIEATGWVKTFLSQLQGKASLKKLGEPRGFQGKLRPYQIQGFSWLAFLKRWGLGACLADDMGLGKTPQTLASILHDRATNQHKKPVLLICPTSLTGNWKKEAIKFAPDLSVFVHHGAERFKGKAFQNEVSAHDLVISTYNLLYRDLEHLKRVDWSGVILDEAQAIKNAHTKQAKAVSHLSCHYRVALTGTPVENHVGDLWSLMNFLNPGFLGNEADFKKEFFQPIQQWGCQETTAQLKRMTAPFIMRREKTDKSIITDLPEKMEMDVFCSLSKEQASLYQAVIEEATTSIEKAEEQIQRKGIILATLTKLKQICNHPTQFLSDEQLQEERSGKMMRLLEMVEELLDVGDRALIFTQFSEMGNILKQILEENFGKEVLFLHGAVSKKKRDQMVERFQDQNKDAPPLFILSLKAGGTGLNLTNANHVFHYDRWWNPAVENQATDRAFRIGQKNNVQVHKFICSGTLEERIAEMIQEKKKIAENIVGTSEGWLTKLSTEDLREMWKLRTEVFAS